MILCGFFCAGKSTVGRLLADELKLPFFDTDRMIESAYGKNKKVVEIWKIKGERAFRKLESEVVSTLTSQSGVIALGGGTLLDESNCIHLSQLGTMYYLKCSLPILYQRLLKRGFPAYLDQTRPYAHFEEVAEKRFPIYERVCHQVIETDMLSVSDVCKMITEIS